MRALSAALKNRRASREGSIARSLALASLLVAFSARAQEEIHDPEDTKEEGPPAAAPAPALPMRGSISGYAWTDLSAHPILDNGREAVAAWNNHVYLRLSVEISPMVRAVASVRVRSWTTVERNESSAPFLIVNGENARYGFEAVPDENYLEVIPSSGLRFRAGLQNFQWGQNEVGSPADPLNPRDLRWGLPVELSELKIPIFSVASIISFAGLQLEAVWIPFFTPDRAWLFNDDFALFSPGNSALPIDLTGIAPTVFVDSLQSGIPAAIAPPASLNNSSFAFRLTGEEGALQWGAGYSFGFDRVPQLHLDPSLAQLLVELAAPNPRWLVISTLADQLAPRAAAGEVLASGEYLRQHLFFGEAGYSLGDFVFKLDAAFTSHQTFFTTSSADQLATAQHPLITATLGIDYRFQDRLFLTLTGSVLHAVNAGSDEFFFLAPDVQTLSLFARWVILRSGLELRVLALTFLSSDDVILQPLLSYRLCDHLALMLGATVYQGSDRGPGGFFDHNSAVFLRAKASY